MEPRPTPSTAARLAALGIAAVFVDLAGVYLKFPFGPRGITVGDWTEVAGTFLLVALYAWVALGLSVPARRGISSAFLLAAVAYAMGRGIHVAANSIHDMIDRTGGADPWGLAYLWDEHVGHYMVDGARVAFAILLTSIERPGGLPVNDARAESARWNPGRRAAVGFGALAYGFTYFASAVEGQTVPLALPFSVAYLAWALRRLARRDGVGLARHFFMLSAIFSLLLFAIWGIWHRGFPEFSRTGFLP